MCHQFLPTLVGIQHESNIATQLTLPPVSLPNHKHTLLHRCARDSCSNVHYSTFQFIFAATRNSITILTIVPPFRCQLAKAPQWALQVLTHTGVQISVPAAFISTLTIPIVYAHRDPLPLA